MSLCKSSELGDFLMFLPGILVQRPLTMEGMAKLYRLEMDLLERLMKSSIHPLAVELDSYTLTPYCSSPNKTTEVGFVSQGCGGVQGFCNCQIVIFS